MSALIWEAGGPTPFDELLLAAQRGDERALSELYQSLNTSVLRYLSVNARSVAEDLAQEVWLSVAGSLVNFEGDERQFRTWLFTIARRRLIDHWRASARRVTEISVDTDLPIPFHDEPDARIDAYDAINELTEGLTGAQRDIVVLRVIADLSVEEVASIVGRTPGSVRVIQHRAMRKVAARLSGLDQEDSSEAVTP